ncbi:hypothetical protein PG999_010090 [Apiospora kogelbergensis]|uniref:Bacteriophage T5 Orf172 DNA-binding domain-containing protein n=1 Tax=Apiospora kogelbergensis TaxID=1337665 RepID=A0AAW0QUC0_9PEZI
MSSGTITGTSVFSHRSPLSVFRPHVRDPGPEDTVSYKILETLVKRDFETGSVYMFDRPSSPGYVKIGWTARSVEARLNDWSKCGYAPNLLFRVDNVPWAQRAEALTHHELIKEWRTERQCRGPHCGRKSHQEWFEVSKEKAQQVVDGWASVLKEYIPYDQKGALKPQWRQYVKQAAIDGKEVTAQNLWEYHESARVGSTAHLVVPVSSGRTLNLKEVEEEENGCLRLAEEKETLATRVKEEELEQKGCPHTEDENNGSPLYGKPSVGCGIATAMEPAAVDKPPVHKDEPSVEQDSSFLSPPQAPVVPIASCPRFSLKALADVNSLPAASQTAVELDPPTSALPGAIVKQESFCIYSLRRSRSRCGRQDSGGRCAR